MGHSKQIFQTNSRWRWRTFKWLGRLILFSAILILPVIIITLARGLKPGLPVLVSEIDPIHQLVKPSVPAGMNAKEAKKYTGFDKYLIAREKIERLKSATPLETS